MLRPNLHGTRLLSTRARSVLSINNADVFRFGDGDAATPVFSNFSWNIRDGESWCVVGAGAKSSVVEVRPPPTSPDIDTRTQP